MVSVQKVSSAGELTKRPTATLDLIKRLQAVGQGTEQRKALYALANRMVDIFKDEKKPSYSNEASHLSTILSGADYVGLLEAFINAVSRGASDNDLVDPRLLTDLCYVLRNSNDNVSKPHLLKPLLTNLHTRIKSAEGALQKQYQLICTLGNLLDAMVDIKISGIDRENTHEPLLNKLRSLRNHSEPRLAQASRYAYEALRGVPDDEGQWQAICRYSWMVLEPTANIAAAISTTDPTKAIDAASKIFTTVRSISSRIEARRDMYTASESLQNLLLQTLGYLPKEKLWYGSLRYSGILIEDRELDTLKELLPGLKCLRNESFWCGLFAQLEQSWVKNEGMRDDIDNFIEWTLYEFPVRESCPREAGKEYPRFQSWVTLVANTLGRPDWKKDQRPPSWRQRIFKNTDHMPTLEIFCKLERPQSDDPSHDSLLDKAWSKCEKAQAFFAQVAAEEHYTKGNRLEITRISGALLPMERCYINLAIVESLRKDRKSLDPIAQRQAELSLFEQLKVARPQKERELSLKELFDLRTLRKGQSDRPKRVLIRGRAGVGKTTLCKKIMHDFYLNKMWKNHFEHVFWIPLRRLKGQVDLEGFLKQEYFLLDSDKDILVPALLRLVLDQRRTLLILDGLDEIVGEKSTSGHELMQLFRGLFDRDNIIVTSRPYAAVPAGGRPFDLELETIGFHPQQVKEYIKSVADPKSVENIERFIEQHPIIQGLVQIPIQLDALCFGWDERDGDFSHNSQKTMTSLYQAISKKLWRKDMQQLLMKSPYETQQYRELGQIKRELSTEVEAIETLAFYGLVNNIIEFQPWHLKALYTQFPQLNDGHLNKISFLRTSDTSSDYMKNYHFLHLTFQEFFAAQHFIRSWIDGKSMNLISVSSNGSTTTTTIVPEQFLRQEKYTARYNIMWRFVAGLLSFANKEKILDFMNILESEPRDIFGTGHLRVLMHCFSEVGSTDDEEALKNLRTSVEKRLLRLFLIEVPNPTSGYTSLAREIEFPEHLIQKALLIRESRYNNSEFHDSLLCERFKSCNLPPGLVGGLISCQYSELPRIVGHFYQSFSTLPLDYLECPHKRKRRDFYSGLHNGLLESESLPEIIVNRIIQNFHRDQVLSLELLARNATLSIDARMFLLSKVLDLNIPHKELAVLKRGHHLPTQETLLSLLNHDDLEKRTRGISLSRFYRDLDVNVLQRLLILSESQYSASDAGNFTEIYQWIAEALINQESLSNSILHQALDFCHRENFARDIRLMPSCTILAKTSLLQGKDYEALFSNGSWNQCLYQCKGLLLSLLPRFKDQFLAELHCKDSVVVSQALESMRWVNYNDLPQQIVESLVEMINHGIFDHARMAVDVLEVLDLPANTARSLAPAIHSLKFPQLFHVFRSSRTLPEDVLTLLLPHLELDLDRSMSAAFGYASYPVIMILRNQIKLPSAIVQNLLSSLESESAPEGATIAAEFIFRDHADFYSMLPGLSRLAWQALFEIWTDRSVDENLNFYVLDDVLHINMPEGSWQVKIDTPEVRGKLQYGIEAAEKRLRELEAESCPQDLLDN